MKHHLHTLLFAGSFAFATAAQALLIDFNTAADYDGNFVEKNASGELSWNSGEFIRKIDGNAASVFYNQNATGGTSGSGGTTFGSPRDTFGGTLDSGNAFRISADFRSADNTDNAISFGFYLKVNTGETSGYAILYRLNNNADVRLFDSGGNPSSAGVGSGIGSNDFGGQLAVDTWYTAQVDVEDVGSGVQFSASLFNQGGSQIGSTHVFTDTSSPVFGDGQVGMRLSTRTASNPLDVDNFSVTAIPEPGTLALVGIALGSLLLIRRRR